MAAYSADGGVYLYHYDFRSKFPIIRIFSVNERAVRDWRM